METFHRFLSILTLLALMSGSAVMAQDDREYDAQRDDQSYDAQPGYQANEPDQPDPPARAARLQFMSGSVSVQPHGTDDWVGGALNRPLTNSDNVWADKNSRAEISVGTGVIRIDSESSLTLTNIGENIVQLQLHQGAMNLHVRRLYDGETFEVDTPNQAFTVLKPGDYRFDVDPNSDTTVITVWRGLGESTGDGPAVRIRGEEQARFSNGTSLNNDIHRAPSPDGFDEWASSRDNRFDHSQSARYVSPDVVGSEDLDEYGTWRDVPEYGNIWVPRSVEVGWSPYRNGRWIWVDPWGWTWVEDEPWGYAPFHYGRWVYYDNYWGWAPGPIYARPYYSPALVAWFGGPSWGVSFGYGGGYGWCPLGFGEPYIPWYGVSRRYFNNVNITNTRITNITNIYNNTYINNHPARHGEHGGQLIHYANMRAPNGFTAVSRNTLVNSQPVARNNVRVSPNELGRVSPVRNVDARPTRTTMLGSSAGRQAAVPPQRSFARPIVSRVAPPANSRGTFHNASPVAGVGRNESSGSQMRGIQRPAENIGNRGPGPNSRSVGPDNGSPNNNVRMPGRESSSSRSVPRPPSAGGFDNRGNMGARPENGPRSNVSRPAPGSQGSRPEARPSSPEMNSRGSLPRPPSSDMPRSQGPSRSAERPSSPRESAPPRSNETRSNSPRSNERSGGPRSEVSVPRPTNPVTPRGYSSAGDRGTYPTASNGRYQAPRPSPSYQSNPRPDNGRSYNPPTYGGGSYSRPAPSYDRGPSGRSAPSYGGGSYQRPGPAPSYGGGSYGRPAPSYDRGSSGRSAPSYGGGGRAPSYGGGGYNGGGRASSGGGYSAGGHPSAPSRSSGSGERSNSHDNNPHGRH
jgi:hypothetical protein